MASSKSANYQEIFEIERDGSVAKVIFDYSGDAKVKPPRLATGDKDLFSDFRTSVEQAASRDEANEDSRIDWLYSFIQEKVLPGHTVQVESSTAYRDVLRFEGGRRVIHGARGTARRAARLTASSCWAARSQRIGEAVGMIKAYYRLDNE